VPKEGRIEPSFGVSTTPKEGSIRRLWTPRKNDREVQLLVIVNTEFSQAA